MDEQGALKVAGMLRNEPGALFFYSAPFFYFLPTNAILRARFFINEVNFMTTHDRVRQQLHALEALLREHNHWRMDEPEAHLFTSTQPFCMDTMEPVEWLQWVLIPRMHALLDNAQPLPEAFAIAPYYEMALTADHPQREVLLVALQELDALFTSDKS